MLREQFNNGRLDAAASKAEILEELCDKLNFDPDAAAALHKQLYRERLMSVVADKKVSGDLRSLRESHLIVRPSHRQTLPAVEYRLVERHFSVESFVMCCFVQKAKGPFAATFHGQTYSIMEGGMMCFCHCAEEDANELDRLRRLLCIPRADVDKVNKEICGRIYQEVSPLPLLISGTAMAGGVAYVPAWQSGRLLHGFLCVRNFLRCCAPV